METTIHDEYLEAKHMLEEKYYEAFASYNRSMFSRLHAKYVVEKYDDRNTQYLNLVDIIETINANSSIKFESLAPLGTEVSLKTTYDPSREILVHIGGGVYIELPIHIAHSLVKAFIEDLNNEIKKANEAILWNEGAMHATKELMSDISYNLLNLEFGFDMSDE